MNKEKPRQTNYLPSIKSIRFPYEIEPKAYDTNEIETPAEARRIGLLMAKKATRKMKLRFDV